MKQRFSVWKFSTDLEAELYRTAPLHDVHDSTAVTNAVPVSSEGGKKARQVSRITSSLKWSGWARRMASRAWVWQAACLVLVAIILAEHLRPQQTPVGPGIGAVQWKEQVYSAEWTAWRMNVHQKLSSATDVEEAVAEAMRLAPPPTNDSPAVALGHDQAVADVLLSYPRVVELFRTRLGWGFGETFLGTGLSNPVNLSDYGNTSVHEYLIPNKRNDEDSVWMRTLNPIGLEKKKVGDLIEEDTEQNDSKKDLLEQIATYGREKHRLAETKDKVGAVIRFQILPKGISSGRLGRKECWRVFGSDLAEVWDVDVKTAANLSGYTYKDGDTFFVWVFVPAHGDDAVQATWGNVLKWFPKWMEKETGRNH